MPRLISKLIRIVTTRGTQSFSLTTIGTTGTARAGSIIGENLRHCIDNGPIYSGRRQRIAATPRHVASKDRVKSSRHPRPALNGDDDHDERWICDTTRTRCLWITSSSGLRLAQVAEIQWHYLRLLRNRLRPPTKGMSHAKKSTYHRALHGMCY